MKTLNGIAVKRLKACHPTFRTLTLKMTKHLLSRRAGQLRTVEL